MVTAVRSFETLREEMVERQLRRRGIGDEAVLAAMNMVPRERFVAAHFARYAYDDTPLPILARQTISQPYIIAYMLEALALGPADRVLEVGSGCGYVTAVMSRIAQETVGVERQSALVRLARRRLADLGYANATIQQGDGTLGWPERAAYDAILVSAGGADVPAALLHQLKEGGRLVMPVGRRRGQQVLRRVTRRANDQFDHERLAPVSFVPLVGGGWPALRCDVKELGHTADVGVRVRAGSAATLFAGVARAMFQVAGAAGKTTGELTPHPVALSAADRASLLVDWLNELLFIYADSGQVCAYAEIVEWRPTRLKAIVYGRRPDQPLTLDIKAATYHQLRVTRRGDRWTAVVFFDV